MRPQKCRELRWFVRWFVKGSTYMIEIELPALHNHAMSMVNMESINDNPHFCRYPSCFKTKHKKHEHLVSGG